MFRAIANIGGTMTFNRGDPMAQLFETERHEPLIHEPWDPARIDAAIDHIVTRTKAAFLERGHWPSHVDDVGDEAPQPLPDLYFGAAGIVWALAQFDTRIPNDAAVLRSE